MPRKVRELLGDLKAAGFTEVPGGKGSHRKLVHPRYAGSVILSGGLGDDAKPYQERQLKRILEALDEAQ